MKLCTFNIRLDCGCDGNNNFCYRKPLILKTLAEEQPDVLCFQEVLPHVADWMRQELKGYYVVGCGRDYDLEGEQLTVAFRADKYALLEMETYWLSETPYVPGSRYPEQSDCPRVCTQVVLREFGSGKLYRVVNVHLDHIGAYARKIGLEQVLRHVESAPFCPDAVTIITGDYNTYPGDGEMGTFDNFPGYTNVTEGIGLTWHDFQGDNMEDTGNIDYIFVKGDVHCTHIEKWKHCENGVFLSDHYPVCAVLEFPE